MFLGWAQVWCENARPEAERLQAQTNPHSPDTLPRQRRRVEHAGVPEGVRVQGERADGAREPVPGLVRQERKARKDRRRRSGFGGLRERFAFPASWCTRQIISCERCPRLRSYCAEIARTKRRAFRDEIYWGKPVPGFGDPRARVLLVGARAGGARRQPHRARVHRRRRRRVRRLPDGARCTAPASPTSRRHAIPTTA